MVSAEIVRSIVGIIGNVIAFCLFLSPVPTFGKIIKKKSTEEFQPYPYIATVLNCSLWVFYGMPFIHPDSILIVTINAIGVVIELVYLIIFFIYAPSKGRKTIALCLIGEIAFMAIVVLVTMYAFHGTSQRSIPVGVLSVIFNIIMYFSPLTIMLKVIRTKSTKYMPFFLSFAGFCNGVCWTCYALIGQIDPYVLVSNGLGAIAGAFQLLLYACYCGSTPKEPKEEVQAPSPAGVQLQENNV